MSTSTDQILFKQWLKSALVDERVRPEVAALVHLEPDPKYVMAGAPVCAGHFETTISFEWRLVVGATSIEDDEVGGES